MRIVRLMAAAALVAAPAVMAQVPLDTAAPAPEVIVPQVPPGIAAQLRQLGPVVDPAGTARIYRPLHAPPPYRSVTVTRDLSYGPDPRQRMDVFTEAAATPVAPILTVPVAPPGAVATPAPAVGAPVPGVPAAGAPVAGAPVAGAPVPEAAPAVVPAPGVLAPAPVVPVAPVAARPVLIYVSGGAGNKIEPVAGGDAFYDNIMLWAVKNGLTGINVQRLATPGRSAGDTARDIGLVVDWVQKNIGRYGGNPARVFIWAHSAGNAAVARYLADPGLPKDHGVRGAILMGATAALVPPATSAALAKRGVPLFVAAGELDLPAAVAFVESMKNEPCEGAACAKTAIFADHSHMSAVFAPNTADESVTAPLLQWMAAVP